MTVVTDQVAFCLLGGEKLHACDRSIVIEVSDPPAPHYTAVRRRAVDSDMLAIPLNGKEENICLIGVDTPQAHQSAKLDRDAERMGRDKLAIKEPGETSIRLY